MRRAALLIAFSIASAGVAAADPVREHVPRPTRTITIRLDPTVVHRGVAVDGTMIPRRSPGLALPTTPAPKCKKDRRGAPHCVETS